MTQTFTQLITRTQERLSQAAGAGIQVYAEDRIGEYIQAGFDEVFDDRFWPEYSNWITVALDGTLGVSTTDLTDYIKRFVDIGIIYREGSQRALPRQTPFNSNPNAMTGTTAVSFASLPKTATNYTDKVFHVWPKTATGNLDIYYRTKPDAFVAADEVFMDDQLLIWYATWKYREDDATNPAATDDAEKAYLKRLKDLQDLFDSDPVALNPGVVDTSQVTLQLLSS